MSCVCWGNPYASCPECVPSSLQGPIHIGTGCFVSDLDTAQSEALRGLELHDLVLQGHCVRLPGSLGRAFTLVGRLDSWEVGVCFTCPQPHHQAVGNPQGILFLPHCRAIVHQPEGQAVEGCGQESPSRLFEVA